MKKIERLYGRLLLEREWTEGLDAGQISNIKTACETQPGQDVSDGKRQCNRCLTSKPANFHEIPCRTCSPCYYCEACLRMGIVRSCSVLYHLKERNEFARLKEPLLAWSGELSKQQAQASEEIKDSMRQHATHLVWAVTGAGKTEMLFEGIADALQAGKRVAIASPRMDVCRELEPRIQAAFPTVPLITLHGEMEEDYRYTPLLIATTHQLIRFKAAFDVLIIDEIDAFPFYGDDMLHQTAMRSVKEEGALIYLTATPDRYLMQRVKENEIEASILPARYHGYPLPVPQLIWAGNWRKKLLKQSQRHIVIKSIERLLSEGRRFLIFLPHIEWMKKFEKILEKYFSEYKFTSVSSQDPERKEKVQGMRDEYYDFLLSTTILERGVTFSNIDVMVIGAEDRTFKEAALVQIAGRAGRSPDYPSGEVLFFHGGKTQAMKLAIKQIEEMNRQAKERQLLKDV